MVMLSTQPVFAAANFNFTPVGTIPTTVVPGQTVSANFSLKNMTNTPRNGYFITGLPATVTQNTTVPNCTNPINLAANATCNLQFDITGAVSASFAICKGNSCTTATTPLNVSVSNSPALLNRAYITQSVAGSPVWVCSVDPTTGALSGCQPAGGGTFIANVLPQGIAISADNTTAYLTGGDETTHVFQCPITADTGLFGTCTESTITSPSGYTSFYGMLTLNPANSTTYIVDDDTSTGRVLSCPISNNTIEGSCVNAGAAGLSNSAVGIVLNSSNTVGYIGDYTNDTVITCTVNNGVFSSCGSKVGDGFYTFGTIAGVALNKLGTKVYIASYGENTVYVCDTTTATNATHFTSCSVAATINEAWGITINSTNTYAYVTDYNNTVHVCHIAGDNTFDVCTPNATFDQPVDIALI